MVSLARPRTFLLFLTQTILFFASVDARIDSLFTSSVTYCSPPEAILIEQFSIIYFASNQSVSFNISAASVVPNLRVRANIFLNVYGMQPVNLTQDFCQAFGDSLCPLPMYNFTGSTSLKLPASVNVASRVPYIAYKIPDLEAFAQLTLTDTTTGDVVACIQATLSNGWSSRQPAVVFATGGFAIFALFSALLHSFLPSTPFAASNYALSSVAPTRFVDFILLVQQISFTGLLHVNFPLVYRAFTLNFAWALGLFPESQPIQHAINRMRHLTGGDMQDGVQSPTAYVNRQLSPYNLPPPPGKSPTSFYLRQTNSMFLSLNQSIKATDATTDSSSGAGPPATVTNSGQNFLPAGIPVYVNSLNIGTANSFMSVFFTVLIGAVVGAGILGVLYLLLTFAATRLKGNRWAWTDVMHAELRWFAVSNGIRYAIVILYPVLIFTFFQWTLEDSWLSVLLSVILLFCTAAAILYPTMRIVVIARRVNAQTLYTTPSYIRTFGVLYVPYRQEHFHTFVPFLAAALLKSMFVSLLKSSGVAQVIALLLVELMLLVLLCVKRPRRTRGGNVLGIYLAVTRVAAAALIFPFVEGFRIKAIPRVAVGVVLMVVFSIAVLVMVINVILNFGTNLIWRRHDNELLASLDGSISIDIENGLSEKLQIPSSTKMLHPKNPTPSTSFSQDVSTHSRHTPNMNATVTPNYTIPTFHSSDYEDEGASPRHSRHSSFFTASSPPSTSRHEDFPSSSIHISQPSPSGTQ